MLFGWEMKLGRIKHFGATQSSSSSRTTAAVNECHRRTKRAHTAKSNHHTARKTCLSSHLPVGLGVFPHCLLLVGRQMEVHEMVQHWNFTLYVTAISQLIPLGPRRRCTYAHTSLHTRTHTHTYTTRSDVHRKSYCHELRAYYSTQCVIIRKHCFITCSCTVILTTQHTTILPSKDIINSPCLKIQFPFRDLTWISTVPVSAVAVTVLSNSTTQLKDRSVPRKQMGR